MAMEMLWNDPAERVGMTGSTRGFPPLACFGPDITASFLARHGLVLLIRSHEYCQDGFKLNHNKQCVTVFSAPNYQ